MDTNISNALDSVLTETTDFVQAFTTDYFPWILGLFALMVIIALVLRIPRKLVGR